MNYIYRVYYFFSFSTFLGKEQYYTEYREHFLKKSIFSLNKDLYPNILYQ